MLKYHKISSKKLNFLSKKEVFFFILFFFFLIHLSNATVTHTVKREDYINRINNSFLRSNIVVLKGVSGMGKTTIARTFSKLNEKIYEKVYWVNWGKISFEEQILSITKNLKLKKINDPLDLMEGFVNRLRSYPGKILLVIDGLNNIKNIGECLKKLENIKNINIIVTSRDRNDDFLSVDVGPFTTQESKSLLKSIVPDIDEETSKIICENLGNYPFHIVKIAKIISTSHTVNGKRVKDLLLNRTDKEIFSFIQEHDQEKNEGKQMNKCGEEAIKEKINSMRREHPKSYEALVFLSHIHNKTIPIDFLYQYFHHENDADSVINFLIENTFITETEKENDFITFDIHQVTQKIVRSIVCDADKEKIFKQGSRAFIGFYKKFFDVLFDGNREDQVFYSHVLKALKYFKGHENSLPLNILALKRPLYSQRDPQQANRFFLKIQKSIKSNKEIDQMIFADYLCDCIYMKGFTQAGNQEKFKEAMNFGNESIQLYQKLGNNDGVFKSYTRMAWVNLYQGETDESFKYLKNAESLLPDVSLEYAKKEYYFTSSWYYLEICDFDKSIQLALKGIETDSVSKNIYLGLYFRVHLGLSYFYQGKVQEALDVIEEGLEREKELFEWSSGTLAKADLLHVKSLCLLEKKKYLEARSVAELSFNMASQIMNGQPYQETAFYLKTLGEIEEKLGNLESSLKFYMKSKEMFECLTPKRGLLGFAQCLSGLCRIWVKLGEKNKFQEEYDHLLERFGFLHPVVKKLKEDIVKDGYPFLLLQSGC